MKSYITATVGSLLVMVLAASGEPTSNHVTLASRVADFSAEEMAAEIAAELTAEMDLTTNATALIREFAEEVVPVLKREMIRVLVESFTEDEMRVLIRLNDLQPLLAQRGIQAMERYFQQNPELTKDLAERLKKAGGAQQHGGRVSSEGAPSAPPNEPSP